MGITPVLLRKADPVFAAEHQRPAGAKADLPRPAEKLLRQRSDDAPDAFRQTGKRRRQISIPHFQIPPIVCPFVYVYAGRKGDRTVNSDLAELNQNLP